MSRSFITRTLVAAGAVAALGTTAFAQDLSVSAGEARAAVTDLVRDLGYVSGYGTRNGSVVVSRPRIAPNLTAWAVPVTIRNGLRREQGFVYVDRASGEVFGADVAIASLSRDAQSDA